MADHEGLYMSSFFPVEDAAKAREVLEDLKRKIGDDSIFNWSEEGVELFWIRGDYRGLPVDYTDPDTDKDEELFIPGIVQDLLHPEGFCRITDIGNMKFQYIHAMCWDITKQKIGRQCIGVDSTLVTYEAMKHELGLPDDPLATPMKREDVIQELLDFDWESLDDKCLRNVLREGCRGFSNMSNEELEESYMESFEIKIHITEED